LAFKDFTMALPEDKRAAFETEISANDVKLSSAVVIATEAEAEAFAEKNELLKMANKRYRDGKLEETKKEFLKNFNEKDLPKLLEAERSKGQKQPWEIEIEKLKAENEASKKDGFREKQKNRALAKAQALGIPANLVDNFIGLTDEETDAGLKILSDSLIPWRDDAVQTAKEKLGSQPSPKGGDGSIEKQMPRAAFEKLDPVAKKAFVMDGGIPVD
jgi:hypothetical protein